MTTGNKLWALGRAVERTLAGEGRFSVYQHRDGSDEWAVRAMDVTPPINFFRRYDVLPLSGRQVAVAEA